MPRVRDSAVTPFACNCLLAVNGSDLSANAMTAIAYKDQLSLLVKDTACEGCVHEDIGSYALLQKNFQQLQLDRAHRLYITDLKESAGEKFSSICFFESFSPLTAETGTHTSNRLKLQPDLVLMRSM